MTNLPSAAIPFRPQVDVIRRKYLSLKDDEIRTDAPIDKSDWAAIMAHKATMPAGRKDASGREDANRCDDRRNLSHLN